MLVYVLKLCSEGLNGFLKSLLSQLGLPEHALPFETPQVALDCLPAVLHHGKKRKRMRNALMHFSEDWIG